MLPEPKSHPATSDTASHAIHERAEGYPDSAASGLVERRPVTPYKLVRQGLMAPSTCPRFFTLGSDASITLV